MFISSQKAEEQAVLNLAYAVCAAARTAPKACGIDHMDTAILTGEDKLKVTKEMRRLGEILPAPFFIRDADNVQASGAVVLVEFFVVALSSVVGKFLCLAFSLVELIYIALHIRTHGGRDSIRIVF